MVDQVNNDMFKDYGEILEALQSESHRGGVLLGAAILEDYLYKLLKGFMVDDPSKVKKLLEGGTNAPLGSLSAKTLGAYCLGLISEDEFADIEIIRDVRNKFAHRLLEATFDDQSIKDKCKNLSTPDILPHMKHEDAPTRFLMAVSMLSSRIAIRVLQINREQRKKAKPFKHAQHVEVLGARNRDRVPYETALERLHKFKQLSGVIQDSWLKKQMLKSVENYSLITGWLTTSPDDWNWAFLKNTQALEDALSLLTGKVPENHWKKLCSKLRVPSNRAESKGTIAELSLAIFLVTHGISFDMETPLQPPKDVDFSLKFGVVGDVHVEMQSLAESAASQRTSKLSADYGGLPVSIDFKGEERRIIGRIHDKTPKLVENEITLVALDCTAIPEHGGVGLGTIPDALAHIFGQGTSALTDVEKSIRQLVDGVIWFQLDFDNALQPVKRGYYLNEHSKHRSAASLQKWITLWSHEDS